MKPIIALCDANNFYCSCEQVFSPYLYGKPLGVLSNNDGCIIARTQELKALGVSMGTPAFKVRHLVEEGKILLKSSNYALYGDMSSRFMSVLEYFSPDVEIYSIDEAFIDLSGTPLSQIRQVGNDIRQRVGRWTGLPIGVGISSTKTLAKLANYAAKTYRAAAGVVDLTSQQRQEKLMEVTPVDEIWGVGRNIANRLKQHRIYTVADLVQMPRSWIKKQFSVTLERTVCELQGEICIPWEDSKINKHQMVCSRSFGQRVRSKADLHSALTAFICRACEKLRKQNLFAREGSIFISTDPFQEQGSQHYRNHRLVVANPANDNESWLSQLGPALDRIYCHGTEYKKAGFIMMELCDRHQYQADLLTAVDPLNKEPFMGVLDSINTRFGRNTIQVATAIGSGKKRWGMNQRLLSPCYTTCWSDILKINT